ncbi:MAG: hypothetical protein QOK27_2238, partial [Gemmatimonadales bacterium]|nr:hypothetical protein [Gemmatimonadales bacterium]
MKALTSPLAITLATCLAVGATACGPGAPSSYLDVKILELPSTPNGAV